LLDGRQSADNDGSIVTYSWSVINGPPGSSLLNPSKDTSTFVANAAGTYTLRLTVTDNGGSSSADDVTVQVLPPVAGGKRINVNLYEAGITYNNTAWNNWQPSSNASSPQFKYSDGTQSSVSSVLSSHPRFSDNGAGYAAGATICPPDVLRLNSIHTVSRTLTINGLTSGNAYNLEFYGSRGFTSGSKSIFRVANQADTIDTDYNVNDYAKLNGVSADNAGRIVVTLSFSGTYNYFAGFSLVETSLASRTGFVTREKLEAWQVYPNPFNSIFKVNLSSEIINAYSIILTDFNGKILQRTKGVKGPGEETVIIQAGALNKGMYRITLVNGDKKYHKTVAAF
ncbi:MAG: PKD domain-containing protein, partial [Chitinophagaceae bacterium]